MSYTSFWKSDFIESMELMCALCVEPSFVILKAGPMQFKQQKS